MLLEDGQFFGAFRGRHLVFKEIVFKFEPPQLALQLVVLFLDVNQPEVIANESNGVPPKPFESLFHGSDGAHGPDPQQRNVLVGLDLVRQQQQLCDHYY